MNEFNEDIFRAYDIRGVYPTEINAQTAYLVGIGYGSYLQEKYNVNNCVVSHDNRLSSDILSQNLIKGIIASGCNIINYGLTTTPMNYYGRAINNLPGIMVTASHNPKDDNGFKFSFDGMVNARGEMIEEFKQYLKDGVFKKGAGKINNQTITNQYIEYLKSTIKFGKKKLKVVFDCGNGATAHIIRKVFDTIDHVNAIYINEIPDGNFPAHHPDPAVAENMVQLQKAVKDTHADFGVAYDGDGDRLGIVMDNGELLPIEYFMIICIRDMFPNVAKKTFLYDIKCSKSVEDAINALGGTPLCYRTGASYTQYKVLVDDLPFGCEYSGHAYFRDRGQDCASAIYASLRFIEIMSKSKTKLSKMVKKFPKYYATNEVKVPCPDNIKFKVVEAIKNYAIVNNYPFNDIDGVRINYTNGWALVRASNTGPNIIFRAESTIPQGVMALQEIFIPLIDQNISTLQIGVTNETTQT